MEKKRSGEIQDIQEDQMIQKQLAGIMRKVIQEGCLPRTLSCVMVSHRAVSHMVFSSWGQVSQWQQGAGKVSTFRSYFSAAESSPVALPSSSDTWLHVCRCEAVAGARCLQV